MANWLGWLVGMVMAMSAMAQDNVSPLSLAQLRAQLLGHAQVNGEFLQCTTHGKSTIRGSGEFLFVPSQRIELKFSQPNKYTMIFFNDGTQSRIAGGIEQKSPRYSPLSRLLFAIMNLQETVLKQRFEVFLQGSIEQFTLVLTPKKRMAKILHSVNIAGTDGLVNRVQIKTQALRTIIIHLFPSGQSADHTCD